jgi:cell division protein FtsB
MYSHKEAVMAKEKQINNNDKRRARAMQESARKETGSLRQGDTMIQTPEEARKTALMRKVNEQGY